MTEQPMIEQPQYWYNIRTGSVETDYDKSQGKFLLGPYPDREAALAALQTAADRTEQWDEEDRRWHQDDDDF